MTVNIFKKFISKWKQKLKINLLNDSYSVHFKITGLTNISIEFVPPNSTNDIQIIDQGIIRTFKSNFVNIWFWCFMIEKIWNNLKCYWCSIIFTGFDLFNELCTEKHCINMHHQLLPRLDWTFLRRGKSLKGKKWTAWKIMKWIEKNLKNI